MATAEREWRAAVSEFIERADLVVVDLRDPTENVRSELEMIAEKAAYTRTLWLVAPGDTSLKPGREGFSVLRVQFCGQPQTIELNDDAREQLVDAVFDGLKHGRASRRGLL